MKHISTIFATLLLALALPVRAELYIVGTATTTNWNRQPMTEQEAGIYTWEGYLFHGGEVKFMTEEQTLRFNLWASKTPSWTGKFTGEGLPVEQHIDYVRVYAYDVGTKAFTLSWQDDFEGDWFDTKRWSAGNWEMENVKYRDLNIRVENGFVKLRLDYELK